MDSSEVALAVVAALLAVSEALPFWQQTRANGLMHTMLLVVQAGIRQLNKQRDIIDDTHIIGVE